MPANLCVDAGDSSLADMIAATESGLLVTHFHYTNMIDPMKQIITGMTRDGVFRIADGRIAGPVRNLRFTESAFKAFSNVDMLGAEQKSVGGGFGEGFVVPAMRIRDFAFTSTTDF